MGPTFTYWDQEDQTAIAPHLDDWRRAFPDHRAVRRAEARAALTAIRPDAGDLFDRIRIPACRSDLARLALLHRDGGLYVDAHCRLKDADGVRDRMRALDRVPLIVSTRWAPNFGKVMPHNSIVWARPVAPLLTVLLDEALSRLSDHDAAERAGGGSPYHIWSLTGPGVFWDRLFDPSSITGELSDKVEGQVETVFETDNPVERHIHIQHRRAQDHWSERQKTEPLLDNMPSARDRTF